MNRRVMLEQTVNVSCPYCGEWIDLRVDLSAGSQAYVEDCSVCCQPIDVTVDIDAQGACQVDVARSDV